MSVVFQPSPISREPSFDECLRRAIDLHGAGRFEDAILFYRRALTFRPGSAEVYNNIAAAYLGLERLDDAFRHYEWAIDLKPAYARAHLGLATLHETWSQHEKAVEHYRATLAIDPKQPTVRFNLGITHQAMGNAAEAAECFRQAAEEMPDVPKVRSQYLLCLNYLSEMPREAVFAEHRRIGERFARPAPPPHPNLRDPERKLRIGYLSVEFRRHLGGYFIEPILEAADRERFEIVCYSGLAGVDWDERTARFRTLADGWREVAGVPDEALIARIREDRIDILVELAGHSGLNRLAALARRPAPVQATWLGYPNTTGMTAIDYRLVDRITDPEDWADALASERLVRLPRPFLGFKPPADAPDVEPPPAAAGEPVTFGSFNSLAKMSPETVRLWSAVLRAVPDSRLLLKDRSFLCPQTCELVRKRFAAQGVAPERVTFHGPTAGHNEHLAIYNRVDIALDPIPYNGTITTCDALWMGVPLLTLAGDRHAARVGASLLDAVGLGELVAADAAGFVERAVDLARDPARLAALKLGMRDRLLASPLCDTAAFTAHLEAAYRTMWRRWCAAGA